MGIYTVKTDSAGKAFAKVKAFDRGRYGIGCFSRVVGKGRPAGRKSPKAVIKTNRSVFSFFIRLF